LEAQINAVIKAIGDNERATKNNKDNFENACKIAGKRYKDTFGGKDFHSWAKCAERVKSTNGVTHNFDEIKKLYDIAFDPKIQEYRTFQRLNLSRLQGTTAYELLGKAIVSSTNSSFADFIKQLGEGAFDWFSRGHEHYEKNADGKCPYCHQPLKTLTKDIQKDIANCFDVQYQQDINALVRFQSDYTRDIQSFIYTLEMNLQLAPLPTFDLTEYRDKLAVFKKTVEINIQRIAEKLREPSLLVELENIKTLREELNAIIDHYNSQVQSNNVIYNSQEDKKDECMRMVWESLAFELAEDKNAYFENEKALSENGIKLENELRNKKGEFDLLDGEIKELIIGLGASTEATSIVINALLKKSGFRGFSLEKQPPYPDRYVIIRESDGQPAKLLSEGERNFIAFLYFYHLVHGGWEKENLKKGKIVVIDDPVSSMDSGVLFIVSSLVRELIEDCYYDGEKHNIQQIFILTHNPYFHKAVSRNYETTNDEIVQKSAFFLVKKSDDNISTVEISEDECSSNESGKENVSPVITSYDAMWYEYRNAKFPSTLVVAASRIIDYHLLQHCSYKIDYLRECVKNHIGDNAENDKKQRIATEMLRFIYDDMHDVGDDISYSPTNNMVEYNEVFEMIFDAVSQKSHFLKMSGKNNGAE